MVCSANAPYNIMQGLQCNYPVKASTTIYEGALVGEDGAGYARGLVAGDRFLGVANAYVTNGTTAGANTVNVFTGRIRMEVALVGTIKDVKRPVYASADDTVTFVGVTNSYIGVVTRYVDATHMEIEIQPLEFDEWGNNALRLTKSAAYTIAATDSGKIIFVDTTAVITLPATAVGLIFTLVCAGADGVVEITIAPNASDMIVGADLTGANDKDLVNTLATARRGDFVTLIGDGAAAVGWSVVAKRGTWTRQG
jgi:hypothetical protein